MSDNLAHALAGACGGMVSMALTYPLITISTRAQVSKEKSKYSALKAQYIAFLKVIKDEGASGLYSGVHSALFGIAVTQGIYYYWYELIKGYLETTTPSGKKRALTTLQSMLAGAIAGSATSISTNPIWVINTRQTVKKSSLEDETKSSSSNTGSQKNNGKPASISFWAAAKSILKEEGIQGFWRGIVPALILVVNPIIQYTVFERLKARMAKLKPELGALDFFFLGAISKLIATGSTYPYIVIKSRMQLKQGSTDESQYKSIADGFRKIIKNEGVAGLYKGIETKLLQSVLTSAFLFAFKEEFFTVAIKMLVALKLREVAIPASK